MSAHVVGTAVAFLCSVAGICIEKALTENAVRRVELVVNQPEGVDSVSVSNGHFYVLEYPDIDRVLKNSERAVGTVDLERKLYRLLAAENARIRWRAAYAIGSSYRTTVGARGTERLCTRLKQMINDDDETVSGEAISALRKIEQKKGVAHFSRRNR